MEMSVALCFDGRIADELRDAGVPPTMLGDVRLRRPDKVRRARQALRSLLAARSFDVVVCHQAWPYAIFGSVVKSAGIPLVSWVHMAQTGGHWLDRLAGRTEPDCYVCNSQFTVSELPPTNARVEVIYAPVALAPPRTASPIAPNDPTNPTHPSLVIIQVSRLEAWKGQRVLLEALARLRDVPAWECWQVGGAQRPAEARYLDTLRADAERLGLTGPRPFPRPALRCAGCCSRRQTSSASPTSSPRHLASASSKRCMRALPVVTSAMGGAIEIVDAHVRCAGAAERSRRAHRGARAAAPEPRGARTARPRRSRARQRRCAIPSGRWWRSQTCSIRWLPIALSRTDDDSRHRA